MNDGPPYQDDTRDELLFKMKEVDKKLRFVFQNRHLCSRVNSKRSAFNHSRNVHKKTKDNKHFVENVESERKTKEESEQIVFRKKDENIYHDEETNVRIPDVTKETNERDDNCVNCICDMEHAIIDLKEILIRTNDLLSKIAFYDCNKYNDIGDEIIIQNDKLGSLMRSYVEFVETKDRKYVDSNEIESSLSRGIGDIDHEILILPGFNLNIPCNHEEEDFMWTMSISRPNYSWIRSDNLPISGYVQKNGVLELYDVDAKNTGNYSCLVSYIDPDNEEPILSVYSHRIQVVTLPHYILRGGNRYKVDICDDVEVDAIATYLPQKLNDILCQNEICDTYVFTPHCRRKKIFINMILVPANIAKLVPVGSNVCGIRCRKAFQDKVALLLSRNLRSVLQKPIVFRLPHHQERLVPIQQDNKKRRDNKRSKRGKSKKHKSSESAGEVGLLIGCPAGYSLQDTHCLPCGVGFYSEDGSSYCKKCPKGSHQPNTGSRTCHACTNPFVDGCHDMIWSSSSIILIVVITVCAAVIISMVSILIIICVKRKCYSRQCKSDESISTVEQCCDDEVIPLLHPEKESSDDENLSDSDNKRKAQKGSKKKLKKQIEDYKAERNFVLIDKNDLLKNEKDGKRKQKRKIIGFQYVPVACLESYRSHRGYSENYLSKISNQKKPPVPSPDFEKEIHHL